MIGVWDVSRARLDVAMSTGYWFPGDIVLGVAIAFVFVNWLFQLYYARVVAKTFDRDATFHPHVEPPDSRAESGEIVTTDGVTLATAFWRGDGSEETVIVFCPEFQGSRWAARHYAAALIETGFDVLSFDFRNQGDSQFVPMYQPAHWLTEFELVDLRSVLDSLATRSDLAGRPIGLVGMSRGGCAALAVASERPNVVALFAEGVFTTRRIMMLFIQRWGRLHMPPWLIRNIPEWHVTSTLKKAMPIIEHRRGCRFVELEGKLRPLESRPLQLVSGRRDSYIPVEVTKAVLAETGHDETSLWEVPGAKHNGARNVHPDEFDERIVTLFSESVTGREYDQA